jgi:spore germination cell wall hydrolase CwlJ-like protein
MKKILTVGVLVACLLSAVWILTLSFYADWADAKIHRLTDLTEELSQTVADLRQENEALQQDIAEMNEINKAANELILIQAELIDGIIWTDEPEADKPDRSGGRPCYELSPEERDLVERVVMAEAEDEPYKGKMLVCQCILNACRLNNKRPAAIIKQYVYATRRPEPSESVRDAVAAVFDKGETVTEEPVIYFYAPALTESEFHERQRFVVEVGGHRFFAED